MDSATGSTNPLSAALEEIRERAKLAAAWGTLKPVQLRDSASDIPRLLAALDAVLKLADEWDAPVPEYDDRMNVRQDCAVKLHEAITRELTRKEAADGR